MPHSAQRKEESVVSLDQYRQERQIEVPTIEIRLLPGGGIVLKKHGFRDADAYRALLACYAVQAEFLEILGKTMGCAPRAE